MAFDWEKHKEEISTMYRVARMTLLELRKKLAEKYPNFNPSISSYRTKLRQWGFLRRNDRQRGKAQTGARRNSSYTQPSASPANSEDSSMDRMHMIPRSPTTPELTHVATPAVSNNVRQPGTGFGQPGQQVSLPPTPETAVDHSIVRVRNGPGDSPHGLVTRDIPGMFSSSFAVPVTDMTDGNAKSLPVPLNRGWTAPMQPSGSSSGHTPTTGMDTSFTTDRTQSNSSQQLSGPSMTPVDQTPATSMNFDTIASSFPFGSEMPGIESHVPHQEALDQDVISNPKMAEAEVDSPFLKLLKTFSEIDAAIPMRCQNGNTLLHLLAMNGPTLDFLMSRMRRTDDINAVNDSGETFLHVLEPSRMRSLDVVQRLLNICNDLGYDFLRKSNTGITGLKAACDKWPQFNVTITPPDDTGSLQIILSHALDVENSQPSNSPLELPPSSGHLNNPEEDFELYPNIFDYDMYGLR